MEFKKKMLTRAIQLLLIGCVSSYSIVGFATQAKNLDKLTTKLIANNKDCFVAAKGCILQVTPMTTSHGHASFNVAQLCDATYEKMLYLHKLPLKDQLSERKYLGLKFCDGIVMSSDMGLPFSKSDSIQDANDGILLIGKAELGMQYVLSLLDGMMEDATKVASGEYSQDQINNIMVEFSTKPLEINRIADNLNFNNVGVLRGGQVEVPVNRGNKSIIVSLTNVMADDQGLNISNLDISTKEKAQAALAVISNAKSTVTRGLDILNRSKPDLVAAIRHDETITAINLNEDIIVVKKMGFSND